MLLSHILRPHSPQVQVTVDYVQAARTEPGQGSFPEKFCCTIMISGVNVAEALVRYFSCCVSLDSEYSDKKTRLEQFQRSNIIFVSRLIIAARAQLQWSDTLKEMMIAAASMIVRSGFENIDMITPEITTACLNMN